MIYAEYAVWVILLILVWDIRRVLRLKALPTRVVGTTKVSLQAARDFRGAIPPSRFVVVRWPSGARHYDGCDGASARRSYEHQHPAIGETVEFWELGNCRGTKEA